MIKKNQFILLIVIILMGLQLQAQSNYPRLLVFDHEKSDITQKIKQNEWAAAIYSEMIAEVTPYSDRHTTDPEWILSRYQMNWKPGKHYTTHISDPSGTELTERSGNAPFPTVRITTHKRPPVAPDGYRYRLPALEDINPYDTDSLWLMQTTGPSGEWSLAEPRLFTGNINQRINELAVQSAILYWLTGEESYARFSSDILFQWARGAYYQSPVEGAGRNGLFCIQSLGDRDYDNLVIAYDFLRTYMEEANYDTQYFQPVFEKLAKTTMLRGFVTNNWYAAQSTTLTYNALSLNDPLKRDYYLSFYLERDTVIDNFGQLALPSTIKMHLTEDGHWKENAGYHDMPVGDLLLAAVPVEKNGYRVFENFPALYQASYAMLRYSFPNLQIMGFGDIGRWKHQSPRNLELAIRFASEYAPELLPGLTGSLNRLIEAGLYDRADSGWYGLLNYPDNLPEENYRFEWERAFELDYARLYGHRNGTDQETGLMCYVQGATYNHNHANGMAMELYGRGYILGADPGIAATYEDSVFVHYYATFAAHNTVVAGGASEPAVPFAGSGGAKHMGEITLSAMEPMAGNKGVSPLASFTETNYTEPSTNTRQQRMLGIIRTSHNTGYYVDIFRSDNEISNDYLYHNLGHEVKLYDGNRNMITMQTGSIPYQPNRQSGMAWMENIMTPDAPVESSVAVFRIEEERSDDVYMQMLMPLQQKDKIYTATSPRTSLAPTPINNLSTPTAVIHRPEAAWEQPFAVIYEPYRGENGYSVRSARRIATQSSFVVLEIENQDGCRQLIMQSDAPKEERKAEELHLTGHYGVVSLCENNDEIQYIYLGGGKSAGWKGYRITSHNNDVSANVEFHNNELIISCSSEITMQFPYLLNEVLDETGNQLNISTSDDTNTTVVIFPKGLEQKYHVSKRQ
jgi:hypothetical protein